MLAIVFLRINQHTKCKVRSFAHSKDMIGAKLKKNESRDADRAH